MSRFTLRFVTKHWKKWLSKDRVRFKRKPMHFILSRRCTAGR